MTRKAFQRIMIKMSGEALQGEKGYGIDAETISSLADEISEIQQLGVEVAIVVGGGNIFRGVSGSTRGMDRVCADHMGMLATVINALAMQDALEKAGCETRVQTAIEIQEVAEPYIRLRAMRHLQKKRIVIFGAGTGNPYFTTDTAACLRAMECRCEVIIKGTKVDGVYDKDPEKFADAHMFEHLTYLDVLARNLRVMDTTAISLCMENNLPIRVVNIREPGNLLKVAQGHTIGTSIGCD